jgi:hypothetical protein
MPCPKDAERGTRLFGFFARETELIDECTDDAQPAAPRQATSIGEYDGSTRDCLEGETIEEQQIRMANGQRLTRGALPSPDPV